MPDERRVAVCDTTPLQYLHQLAMLDLLRELYESVLVPTAVREEVEAGRAIGVSLPALQSLPWVGVRAVDLSVLPPLPVALGRGEREALALASGVAGAVLLTDDRQARRCAGLLGLRVSGTLGVLLGAKDLGLIARLHPLLDALDALGFRLSEGTRQKVLALADE